MKVLFTGYYGMKNSGDDVFTQISLYGAKKYWETTKIGFLTKKQSTGNVDADFCIKDTDDSSLKKLIRSYSALLTYEYLIWSGGSVFYSKTSFYSIRRVALMLSNAKSLNLGAIGVSLGPYTNTDNERYVHKLLQKFKFLSLRDERSYDEALSLQLPYSPILSSDLAFMLPEICTDKPSMTKGHVVGISVCLYESYVGGDVNKESGRIDRIKDLLKKIHYSGYSGTFRLFVFNGNSFYGDDRLTRSIEEMLLNIGAQVEYFPYNPNPLLVYKSVSQCDVMISSRLHGSIFAAVANVPCLLIEYHKKVSDFFVDIGVAERWRIGDIELSDNEIIDLFYAILFKKGGFFYKNRELMLHRVLNNFKGIYELCAK